jgi:hypothetical protein
LVLDLKMIVLNIAIFAVNKATCEVACNDPAIFSTANKFNIQQIEYSDLPYNWDISQYFEGGVIPTRCIAKL